MMEYFSQYLLFSMQLLWIIEMLPLATAAFSEMRADWIRSAGALKQDLNDFSPNVVFLLQD